MSIAHAALRRPVTTVAVTLALMMLGAVSLSRLPVSLLPDVTLPVLTIRTAYPGAAATEVSRFVAEPVEEAVAATPGVACAAQAGIAAMRKARHRICFMVRLRCAPLP